MERLFHRDLPKPPHGLSIEGLQNKLSSAREKNSLLCTVLVGIGILILIVVAAVLICKIFCCHDDDCDCYYDDDCDDDCCCGHSDYDEE